jgi:hypothetical protein
MLAATTLLTTRNKLRVERRVVVAQLRLRFREEKNVTIESSSTSHDFPFPPLSEADLFEPIFGSIYRKRYWPSWSFLCELLMKGMRCRQQIMPVLLLQ